jgi:hypothetical protein
MTCPFKQRKNIFHAPHRQPRAVWSEAVLAHVLNERGTLETDDRISADRLMVALASFGLTAKSDSIAVPCPAAEAYTW